MTHFRNAAIAFAAVALLLVLGSIRPQEPPAEPADLTLARARHELARAGQFGLVIDFPTGRAELLHGAALMRSVELTGAGSSLPRGRVHTGRVTSRRCTLQYEPIQRVQAPDAPTDQAPENRPLDADPAFGVIRLDSGVEIELHPEGIGVLDHARVSAHRAVNAVRASGEAIARTVTLKEPAPGRVTLDMRDADARAIFRALPEGAPVTIRVQ